MLYCLYTNILHLLLCLLNIVLTYIRVWVYNMCIRYAYYCHTFVLIHVYRERWALVQEEKQLLKDLEAKADDAKDTRLGEYYLTMFMYACIYLLFLPILVFLMCSIFMPYYTAILLFMIHIYMLSYSSFLVIMSHFTSSYHRWGVWALGPDRRILSWSKGAPYTVRVRLRCRDAGKAYLY